MAGVGDGGWGLGGGGGGGDSVPEARPDVAHTPDTWCSEPRQTSSPPNSPPLAVSPFASLGGAGHTGLPRPQTPGLRERSWGTGCEAAPVTQLEVNAGLEHRSSA